ncbi:MAG: DoxX family protein [Parvularculaceae bacterium]
MTRIFGRIGVLAVAFVFVAAAAGKFANAESIAVQFEHFHLPHWFMLLTGAIELSGALMLLLPAARLRLAGAALLGLTMLVGSGFHFFYDPPACALPALMLAAATGLIAMANFRSAGKANA